jgi:hypothetical protein
VVTRRFIVTSEIRDHMSKIGHRTIKKMMTTTRMMMMVPERRNIGQRPNDAWRGVRAR